MTDYGAAYKYQLKSEADGGGVDVSEAVIVATDNGTQYYRWTTGGGWHQYKIAEGVPTVVDGTYTGIYTVKALVKASETCSFNVDMRWGWGDGQQVGATVVIPQSDEFVEVEWSYSGISGTSCDLIAQPGGTNATIEWKSLAVYSYDGSKNHVLRVTNSTAGTELWDRSATYTLPSSMVAGKTYVIQADVNAVNGGAVQLCYKVASGEGSRAKYSGSKGVLKNEFTRVSWEFTPEAYDPEDLYSQVEFQFGRIEGKIYIDNFSCKEKDSSTELVTNGGFDIPNSVDGWTLPGGTGQSIQQTEKALGTVETKATALCTVGSAGFITFITGEIIEVDEDDAKVYIAKYVKPSVILTPCSVVPSWTPVIVEATAGDHVFRSTEAEPDKCGTNELILKWSNTEVNDENYGTIFALGMKSSVVGFYKVAKGQYVPAGKAYLVITDLPDASREFVGFEYDNETTGIGLTETSELRTDNAVYDMQGRRVAQPTKGLYIVNGKKVIIK